MNPYQSFEAFMHALDADAEEHRADFDAAVAGGEIQALPGSGTPVSYSTSDLESFWRQCAARAVAAELLAWADSPGDRDVVRRRVGYPVKLAELVERVVPPLRRSTALQHALDGLRSTHAATCDEMSGAIGSRLMRELATDTAR